MFKFRVWSISLVLMVSAVLAAAVAHAGEDFLSPEEAFVLTADMTQPDEVTLAFTVAPGYYLYKDHLGFTTRRENETAVPPATFAYAGQNAGMPARPVANHIGAVTLPSGEITADETFGKKMEVYRHTLRVAVPIKPGQSPFVLDVAYQGCADAGLCYPPTSAHLAFAPANGGWQIVARGGDDGVLRPVDTAARSTLKQALTRGDAPASIPSAGGPVSVQRDTGAPASSASMTALFSAGDLGLADALGGLGGFKTIALFFGLGVLLALTPCVLPMIPILSAIVVKDGAGRDSTRLRGFSLAAAYVAGMSVVYTALGVAAGLSGAGLAGWLQQPWILTLFAALLVILALATFGLFTFQMPAGVQARLSASASRRRGAGIGGAAVMGAISALIVGPCVAAPLAGALLYISQTGDVWLGGMALFALAWGMGVPLLVVGATSTSWLPRTGPWMNGVTRFFGMMLLATAWFLLIPVVSTAVQMVGWAVLLAVGAVMLWGRPASPETPGTLRLFARGFALIMLMAAASQIVGVASGGRDPLAPLAQWGRAGHAKVNDSTQATGALAGASSHSGLKQSLALAGVRFQQVKTVAELDAAIAASDRPVMLDFYADWCVSCIEMERFTFPAPNVASRLATFTLLQADVTANNQDDRALLKRFQLFGPPGIVFFDAEGNALRDPRVIGFQNAERFAAQLDRVPR